MRLVSTNPQITMIKQKHKHKLQERKNLAKLSYYTTYVYMLINLLLCLTTNPCTAQTADLHLISTDVDSLQLAEQLKDFPSINCPKPADCEAKLKELLRFLQHQGYLTASIDSLQSDTTQTTAYLFLGQKYQWLQLDKGNVEEAILTKIGFREQLYTGKPFRFQELKKLQKKLLEYAENNAYPFAEVGLNKMKIDENGNIQASLYLNKNRQIVVDSLVIHGKAKISQRYLNNYLNIKNKQPYNESIITNIETRIKELPFLQIANPTQVGFVENQAKVHVFVNPKKASQFNLILGVIPQTNNGLNPDRQRYQITGEGQLNLQNTLGAGELIEVDFKSYPASVQELELHFLYPYLPLLPIGVDSRFELYRRDTSYRDVVAYLGFQYLIKGNNYLKAFWDSRNSTLLSVNRAVIESSRRLPSVLDVRNSLYGLEYYFERLNYRLNPQKGIVLNGKIAVGTKKLRENNAILEIGNSLEGVDFQAQYDSLKQQTFRIKAEYEISKYWKIFKHSTIKSSLKGGYLSDKNALENELYRIGGTRLLRGFDDQSILTNWFNVFTLEYRFLIGQNSYFFLFGDAAFRQTRYLNSNVEQENDYPFGFGAGITFETKAGVFGISYALGRQQNNPIQVRNGKIHFGYIGYF